MLRVCEDFERVRLFVDEIICCSKNGEQHVHDLERFFKRLTNFNLKLAPSKAFVGAAEIIFLEHKITLAGVDPDAANAKVMEKKCPCLKTPGS